MLEAGEVQPALRHGHRALRLGPRVLSVVGVAYRTGRLKLENRVDTLRAEGVEALQRFLPLNFVQTNGAVFRTFMDYISVVIWSAFHYFSGM